MKFYDTSNPHDSAVHFINDLMGVASADTTVTSLTQKARAVNTAKYKVAMWMWKADGNWKFDDNGKTDFPYATTTLVNGQRDYTMPTDALAIHRAEIKDLAGNFYRLNFMAPEDRKNALTNYGESNSSPLNYWMEGRSIFMDPPPASTSVTLASGLKIYVSREIVEFTQATTTSEVGFDEPGDRAVACLAAMELCLISGRTDRIDAISFMLYGGVKNGKPVPGLKDEIIANIAQRVQEKRPAFRITHEDME